MGRSSVFSLEQIYRKQVTQTWSKIPEVFRYVNSVGGTSPAGTDYGYFAGGSAPGVGGPYSTVDRLDFTSDSTNMVTKGPLSRSASGGAATGNTSYGYAAGGGWPIESTVDRVDYSSDTGTASVKGPLETTTGGMGPVTNNTYGYFASGRTSMGDWTTEIQRIEYASDTSTSVVKGTVAWPAGGQGVAGTGNMNYGWFGGGRIYPAPGYASVSFVGRIDYANDTQTAPSRGPLTQIRGFLGAAGNADYGYFGGGIDQNGSAYMSIVDRVDYSNDTATASPKGNLADGKHYISTTGNTSYGYWAGGYGNTTKCQRVDFSNDTATASLKGNLSQFSTSQYAFSSRICNLPTTTSTDTVPATVTESWTVPVGNDAGYFTGGGAPSPYYSVVDRIDFNNDTAVAATKSPTLVATRGAASVNSTTFGYSVAGATEEGSYKTSIVSRLSFAGDTVTQVSVANYPVEAGGITGATGNTDFGYISGGYTPAVLSSVYRMDYSSDSIAASPKGPLTFTVQRNAAAGNQSFGWFAGGEAPSRVSTVQRIDYGNDTATATVKGPLNLVNEYLGATGNASYGYFGGGYFTSKVDRIDYANDTPQTSPKGPLLYSFYSAATGNSSYGYWTQGHPSKTSIGRLEYASDTTTASPKGNLSLARFDTGALSSRINGFPTTVASTPVDKGAAGYQTSTPTEPANYGYWAGGYNYGGSGDTTSIERINFTNDTATASVRGNVTSPGQHMSASSNGSYGYLAGGNTVPTKSHVQRVDYANDSQAAAPKGPLTFARGATAGAGNNDYGWHAGGIFSLPNPRLVYSSVDRIDYANDSSTASPKGPLAATRGYHQAAGNLNYGYFAGGSPSGVFGPNSSTVQRIDYGNDTATASPKGPLSRSTSQFAATGNANYGYFIAGYPQKSTIDRIDYSSDTGTASTKGPLYRTAYRTDATGNPNYGYVHSGMSPSTWTSGSTEIARIDYSNDTATTAIKGTFVQSKALSGAAFSAADNGRNPVVTSYIPRIRWVDSASEGTPVTHGPAFGYFGGGSYPSVSNYTSSVDRIDYGNDTSTATPKGNLSRTTQNHGGASSRTGGYYFGRFPSVSTVDRIDFDNDTATAATKGNLTLARGYTASTGNNDFGYTGGGYPSVSTVDRLDYSNDTANTVEKGSLSVARYGLAATGNQSFGYFVGGQSKTTVDRVDYSSDTDTASPKGPLTGGTRYNTATGNANFGYVSDGHPIPKTLIYRIDYSNDTETAVAKGPLAAGATYRGATSSSDFGYFSGGQNPSSAVRSEISRIDYSNDTATAALKGNLSIAKNKHAGTSSRSHGLPIPQPTIAAPVQPPFPFPVQLYNPATSKQHGYWACGQNRNPSPTTLGFSSVDRLDFSNDTTAASPKGNASFAYANLQSVANASYGYITGGYTDHPPAGRQSSINRLDYANDTAALTVTGSTPSDVNPEGIYLGWGVGNASYGYWGGNYPGRSNIFRLDYSNDTSAPIIAGKSINFSYGAAAGNQDYGWIGGVGHPLPSGGSRVERLDYSNDSNNTVTKGPLSSVRYDGAASSNASYGWWGGGKNGSPAYSYVDRIDFGNDTATASPKGNLQYATSNNQGTGDTNYGYFGGGGPAFSARSYIQRIDYANDTATTSPKGPLSVPRDGSTAFSAAANAMP